MPITDALRQAIELLERTHPSGKDALAFGTALKIVREVKDALDSAARKQTGQKEETPHED